MGRWVGKWIEILTGSDGGNDLFGFLFDHFLLCTLKDVVRVGYGDE